MKIDWAVSSIVDAQFTETAAISLNEMRQFYQFNITNHMSNVGKKNVTIPAKFVRQNGQFPFNMP